MMQTIKATYTLNYLKIYVWQVLSIILNLGALFIVLPNISSNKELYGIYSVCISFTIFLSYADLGFINAGTKFAAEYFAQQNLAKERETIGFVGFILFVFILVFSLTIGVLSLKPEWLFNNLNPLDRKIASQLLGILAISAPVIVLQRILQIIFSIRLEDYILQITLIVTNCLKIMSVFVFFNQQEYNITGYFLCYQLLSFIGLIIAGIIAEKKYAISFFSLGKHFTFSKKIYTETKRLAFGSLFLTISWILFYELDPYILAKITDPSTVAVYAVGLTLLSFYRSIFGALFNPFNARFNHLIGLNDDSSLKGLYSTVIIIMLPFISFSIVGLFIAAKPFIYSWLGSQFSQSVLPARLLILSNMLAFISYPCSILLVAKQKIRLLYLISGILPIVYWLCIVMFYSQIGLVIFAISKLLAFLIIGIFYLRYTLSFLQINVLAFSKKYLLPVVPALLCLIAIVQTGSLYLTITDKSYLNLLYVIGIIITGCLFGFLCYFFVSASFRSYMILVFRKIIN